MRRLWYGCLLAGMAALLASCGGVPEEKLSDTGNTLEGKLTYGGEPVQFAMLIITGASTGGGASVDEDGHYKAGNLPLGPVRIGVNTKAAKGTFQSKMMAASYKGASEKKAKVRELKFIDIPDKYAEPEKSGFQTEIKPGANTFDIAISK